MKGFGSPQALLAAMREDAQAEIERLEQEAAAEVARLDAEGLGELEPPGREERLAAAAREARERVAREDWADSRAALEAREAWIRAAAEQGLQLLEKDRRETLQKLVREAMERLGEQCMVFVAERDVPLVPDSKAAPISGGCIVRSVESPLAVDNSFEERARRFEVQLRAALGKVYAP